MAIDFTDITKNLPSGNNMGGIGQIVYYALHRDVAKWPIRPKAGADITIEQMGELRQYRNESRKSIPQTIHYRR